MAVLNSAILSDKLFTFASFVFLVIDIVAKVFVAVFKRIKC